MGDVLAGLVGALMARGMGAVAGARAAVTWHARAGDLAAARRTETNLLARDVLDSLADVERKTC
jgi:NAD(P)H-hydrate epimerase